MIENLIYGLPIFTYDGSPSLEGIAEELGMVYDPELTQEQIADLIVKRMRG